MQNCWTSNAPTAVFTVVDVDSPVATNDPYATLKTEFATAEELVRASAVLAGATDGGQSAVLADCLASWYRQPASALRGVLRLALIVRVVVFANSRWAVIGGAGR